MNVRFMCRLNALGARETRQSECRQRMNSPLGRLRLNDRLRGHKMKSSSAKADTRREAPPAANSFAVFILSPLALSVLSGGLTARADPPQTLTTQFTYTATVPAPPPGTKALDVWLPIPSDSVWQTVSAVSVHAPVPFRLTRERKYGDRMVYLHQVNPSGPLTATVQFTVRRRAVRVLDAADAPQDKSLKATLGPDSRVPVGGRFRTIAQEVMGTETTTLGEEHALFSHVVATMHYDYHHDSPEYAQGDSAFVCDYKAGNCSDLHSYLISLSRSAGIPATLEFGFPLAGIPAAADPLPVDGAIPGYHCWMWFQDAHRGWVPLDAADSRRWQDANRPDVARSLFGNLVPARSAVAMSRGRDITLSPAAEGRAAELLHLPLRRGRWQAPCRHLDTVLSSADRREILNERRPPNPPRHPLARRGADDAG